MGLTEELQPYFEKSFYTNESAFMDDITIKPWYSRVTKVFRLFDYDDSGFSDIYAIMAFLKENRIGLYIKPYNKIIVSPNGTVPALIQIANIVGYTVDHVANLKNFLDYEEKQLFPENVSISYKLLESILQCVDYESVGSQSREDSAFRFLCDLVFRLGVEFNDKLVLDYAYLVFKLFSSCSIESEYYENKSLIYADKINEEKSKKVSFYAHNFFFQNSILEYYDEVGGDVEIVYELFFSEELTNETQKRIQRNEKHWR